MDKGNFKWLKFVVLKAIRTNESEREWKNREQQKYIAPVITSTIKLYTMNKTMKEITSPKNNKIQSNHIKLLEKHNVKQIF